MSSRPILLALMFTAVACAEPEGEEQAFPDEVDLPQPSASDTIGPAQREADAGLRVLASGQLRAIPDTSRVVGSARILEARVENSSGLQVTTEVNSLPGGAHAWHLHDGPCSAAAQVLVPLGDATAGRPLVIREGGVGEASVYIAGEGLSRSDIGQQRISLRVHERVDGGPIIACADL